MSRPEEPRAAFTMAQRIAARDLSRGVPERRLGRYAFLTLTFR
jgi:hypothetical protein